MDQQPKRRRRRKRRRRSILWDRIRSLGSTVGLLLTTLFELIGYGLDLIAAKISTRSLRKQPTRRRKRRRRIRWEQVFVLGMALLLLFFGLFQLSLLRACIGLDGMLYLRFEDT